MKRAVYGLFPLLVSACTVDTLVAEGQDNDPVLDPEAWCEARCVELEECELEDGDTIGCFENCVTYFEEAFTGKGETCEGAGARLANCVERRGCDGVTVGESCGLSAEEMSCVTSDGRTFCDVGWTGPYMGLPAPMECDMGFEECSDGRVYGFSCPGGGDSPECHCRVDGVTVSRISMSRNECRSLDAERICGWPIPNSGVEPWSDLPVSCGTHNSAATDAPEVDCEIWFDDCSDGKSYAIECDSTGSAECTCMIDAMPVWTFQPMNAVCPYALDPDGGVAAMNYACGFRIAPPEDQP
jgi:hypothetical protein